MSYALYGNDDGARVLLHGVHLGRLPHVMEWPPDEPTMTLYFHRGWDERPTVEQIDDAGGTGDAAHHVIDFRAEVEQ